MSFTISSSEEVRAALQIAVFERGRCVDVTSPSISQSLFATRATLINEPILALAVKHAQSPRLRPGDFEIHTERMTPYPLDFFHESPQIQKGPHMKFANLLSISFVFIGVAIPLQAKELSAPSEKVLLTVSGEISETNSGCSAEFDRTMLEDFEPQKFGATTIWTQGVMEFTGVALSDLLERLGATGTSVVAKANNGFSVNIPVEHWSDETTEPIVAYLIDGKPISLRENGPLLIVYPRPEKNHHKNDFPQSIWQLLQLEVVR